MFKYYFFTVFAIFLLVPEGQSQQANAYYSELSVGANMHIAERAETPIRFTAVAIKTSHEADIFNIQLTINGQVYNPEPDIHSVENEVFFYSKLIHLDATAEQIQYTSSALIGEVKILLINGATSKTIEAKSTLPNQENECPTEPTSIDQSVWRDGLQSPSYTRAFTKVEHVIVHHSAGSNTATNYVQVVRDIYIFHTQGRGWSDVGYNYLIAQDGTIFKGRDPANGAQDNVLGAHFCGSNSNTMGICLLGSYNLVQPTEATIQSLNTLITWKLDKEALDPFGVRAHPINPELGRIGGHRDGCATECPGENVYQKLNQFRAAIAQELEDCGTREPLLADFTYSNINITQGESVQFSESSSADADRFEWLFEGASLSQSNEPNPQVVYPLVGTFSVQLTVFRGSESKIVRKENLVQVEALPEVVLPIVSYPNPIRGKYLRVANLEFDSIQEVYFIDQMGRKIPMNDYTIEGKVLAINVRMMVKGLYMLHIVLPESVYTNRIVVR